MSFRKTLACAFVVTVAAGGCALDTDNDVPTPTGETEEARGRLGKADFPGSCAADDGANYCGGKAKKGKCYCDDLCTNYGDCCADAKSVCDLGNSECSVDKDCDDGFCGYGADQDRVCKPWGQEGDKCGGFVPAAMVNKCAPELTCIYPEPTHDVPGTCSNVTVNPPPPECDPTLICTQAFSCVDELWYPTGCGPANCDEPVGPCPTVNPPPPTCDETLVCAQVLTCIAGEQYPTGCGPDNCDKPIGPCPTVNPPPPNVDTCENSCGGAAPGKACFCDAVCSQYGDCCSDYQDVCL